MTPDINNPSTDLTLENLAHLTVAVERETTATYCRLAEDMKRLHNPEAVQIFERLVEIEHGYEAEIANWARELDLDMDQEPDLDHAWTSSGSDGRSPAAKTEDRAATDLVLTPWQALNMAVQRQQETFEYFSDLAASARDDTVRQQAEKIASQTLEHISLLRLERRQAWRSKERTRLDAVIGLDIPLTLATFEAASGKLFSALRQRYLEIATLTYPVNKDAAALLRGLAAAIPDVATGLEPVVGGEATVDDDLAALLRTALRETEVAFDSLMGVAAQAKNEEVVEAAQISAAACVDRLAQLRDCLTGHIDGLDKSVT
jgi:rubrerythrin